MIDVAPQSMLSLAQAILAQLDRAWADLAEARRTIARLEAGEHRWTCRHCGAVAWTQEAIPPHGWTQAGPAFKRQSAHHCAACTQLIAQGSCYSASGRPSPLAVTIHDTGGSGGRP